MSPPRDQRRGTLLSCGSAGLSYRPPDHDRLRDHVGVNPLRRRSAARRRLHGEAVEGLLDIPHAVTGIGAVRVASSAAHDNVDAPSIQGIQAVVLSRPAEDPIMTAVSVESILAGLSADPVVSLLTADE